MSPHPSGVAGRHLDLTFHADTSDILAHASGTKRPRSGARAVGRERHIRLARVALGVQIWPMWPDVDQHWSKHTRVCVCGPMLLRCLRHRRPESWRAQVLFGVCAPHSVWRAPAFGEHFSLFLRDARRAPRQLFCALLRGKGLRGPCWFAATRKLIRRLASHISRRDLPHADHRPRRRVLRAGHLRGAFLLHRQLHVHVVPLLHRRLQQL